MTRGSSFKKSFSAAVARSVTQFQLERKREAQHMYRRIFTFSFYLGGTGIIISFIGFGLMSFVGPRPAMRMIITLGYFLISLGTIVFSSCDPVDTNIDVIMKRRPTRHVTMCAVGMVGSVVVFCHGEVLSIVPIGIFIYSLWTWRAMAPLAHALSVFLVMPLLLVHVRGSSWEVVFPFTSLVAAPQIAGFLCVQAHWWRHNMLLCDVPRHRRPAEETTAFYTEVFIFMFSFAVFHLMLGIECLLMPGTYAREGSSFECFSYWPPAGCLVLPPAMLLVVGRQRWFSFFARRFNCDPKRQLKDAAFLSKTLDEVRLDLGEEWWCFREKKDHSFPATDQRHHYRRGIIVSVHTEHFMVKFPANSGETPEVISVATAGRNSPMDEMTDLAREQLRCMEWESFTLELLASGPICGADDPLLAANQMIHTSRSVAVGERIDFFLSHCWYDDPVAKYEALCNVAESFKARRGRYPTFWLDKTCLDQSRLADGLRVLPLTIMSCDRLIMLTSPQYTQRLWCVWELFTIMAFFPMEQALERIVLVLLKSDKARHGVEEAHEKLCTFQAHDAKCFDPNDENRLRKVIAAMGEERFNLRIQHLGEISRQRAADQTDNGIGRLASPTEIRKLMRGHSRSGWKSPPCSSQSLSRSPDPRARSGSFSCLPEAEAAGACTGVGGAAAPTDDIGTVAPQRIIIIV